MTRRPRVQVRIPLHAVGLGGLFALLGIVSSGVAPGSARAADPAPAAPAPAIPSLLPIGSPSPNIKATAHNGEAVDLGKLKGQYVVFYFYPKDDTAGCTKQACDIRDNWGKLKKAGVAVFGVSTQNNESHKAFAAKHTLPFPLLPDDKGEIAQAFGVPVVDGKARRVSYLIGKDGKIQYVWPKAATTGHAAEILAQVETAK
jgi:thioredoxin-dependent peroxiredoxin